MTSTEKLSRVYEELSGCYGRQKQGPVRDRLLVLAADAACQAGKPQEAERLRARLLQLSPHHLLKPFPSFAEAIKTKDVQTYVAGLKRTYPPHAMEGLLETARKGLPLPDLAAAPPLPPSAPPAPANPVVLSPVIAPAPAAPPTYASAPTSLPARSELPVQNGPAQPRNRLPEIYGVRMEPNGAKATSQPQPETESAVSMWVCTLAFALTLAGGVALAAYCAARPFFPAP